MRQFTSTQGELGKNLLLGATLIEDVWLDPNCRDEITKTLRGLQEIYRNKPLLEEIKRILNKLQPDNVSALEGRKGMDLWVIFVLVSLRLSCNWDLDKLKSCFDNHHKIRELAGVDLFCDAERVTGRQTIHDNLNLFTKEITEEINTLVVSFGHKFLFPNEKELLTRCDSFVFETNVHFPTDLNLLKDSVRKILTIGNRLATFYKLPGWREALSLNKKFHRLYNDLSRMRHSTSANEKKKEHRRLEIVDSTRNYLKTALAHLCKAKDLYLHLKEDDSDFKLYIDYTELFINQIQRRVLEGETIHPDEKIYSIFEPQTEWICKGKAGIRQELGVKVCVIEDQFGFILNHHIMNGQQDNDVAVQMVSDTKKLFNNIKSVSFDKGFYSKPDKDGRNNLTQIQALGVEAHLPVKGRRNKETQIRESQPEFIAARKQHPAVESAINALESHGFNRCLDKGPEHFDRYAALAVTASNIHNIGAKIRARELEIERRKKISA